MPYSTSVPIILGIGAFFALVGLILVVPWIKRTVIGKENLPWYTLFYACTIPVGAYGYYEDSEEDDEDDDEDDKEKGHGHGSDFGNRIHAIQGSDHDEEDAPNSPVVGHKFGVEMAEVHENDPWVTKVGKFLAPGFYMNIGDLRPEDAEMHAKAFQALPQTEEMFKTLQLTSCFFFTVSHGANDIANALAPLASVWLVYSTGELSKKAPIPFWVMVYGGVALDIGLVMSGHHIMAALGNRLTLLSPSRGFCIELGAMFTVMVFSRLGFPISTTHCMTGATTGVGLCNGDLGAVNWLLLMQIFLGWIITCPAAGCITGLVFWGIASAPNPTPGNGYFTGEYVK